MDREWFEVIRGTTCISGLGAFLNEDAANSLAASCACDEEGPVDVVRCRRTTVRTFQRAVTVSSTEVSVTP